MYAGRWNIPCKHGSNPLRLPYPAPRTQKAPVLHRLPHLCRAPLNHQKWMGKALFVTEFWLVFIVNCNLTCDRDRVVLPLWWWRRDDDSERLNERFGDDFRLGLDP